MTKKFFAILLSIFIGISVSAQEVLTDPAFNPVVAKQHNLNLKLKRAAAQSSTALTLPFYDDFSVLSVFPSPLRWTDSLAFVNADYAKYPLTIGVATLDAINDEGALYPDASKYGFDADYLTSQPIRLDSVFFPDKKAISRSDSVYLSFYYQPQGRAISPPANNTSLILEFHSPGDSVTTVTGTDTSTVAKWTQVWSTDGGVQVDTFALPNNRYFRQVLIPITRLKDSVDYYKNGFQFRFHNIASLFGNSQADWRSNGSNWNLDIVYLRTGGNVYDTAYPDVAFGSQAPSMLRNYQSMPFRQYRNNFINEMKDTLDISIGNLDNKLQNRIYKYYISKDSESPSYTYDGGTHTLKSFLTYGYTDYKPWATPPVNYFFPTLPAEKVVFHITHVLSPDPEPLFQSNDTTIFDQMFSNYYAYDDGTAEAGIGINNAPGSYAVQFKLNVADTLRGIQIYFNQVLGGTNEVPLDLIVWNDDSGKPGQIMKVIRGVIPSYTNLNEFTTYWFDTPQVIHTADFPGLYFYIGWAQAYPYNMNVGFDRSTDSHTKRYYNVSGAWEMSDSLNYGSLLLRPIVGLVNPLGVEKPPLAEHLSIRPNPVTDGNMLINLPETWKQNSDSDLEINIISATGSRVLSETFSNPVNVGRLTPGFYLVTLTDTKTGKRATAKLIIR